MELIQEIIIAVLVVFLGMVATVILFKALFTRSND